MSLGSSNHVTKPREITDVIEKSGDHVIEGMVLH